MLFTATWVKKATGYEAYEPYEVRVRVAARCSTEAMAWDIVNEVETLYTNGPAGGGGAHRIVKEMIAVQSCLIPEDSVKTQTYWFGSHRDTDVEGPGLRQSEGQGRAGRESLDSLPQA